MQTLNPKPNSQPSGKARSGSEGSPSPGEEGDARLEVDQGFRLGGPPPVIATIRGNKDILGSSYTHILPLLH